jgi:hypothetical protein
MIGAMNLHFQSCYKDWLLLDVRTLQATDWVLLLVAV